MKFDDGTAWGRDENGKGKGTKSVPRRPNGPSRPPSESPPKARNANNRNGTEPRIPGLVHPPPPN